MARKEIVVSFDEEGNTEIEAIGYTDGACRKATKEIEEALGKVTKRKIKDPDCDVKQTVKIR